jgi:hypothetical protein
MTARLQDCKTARPHDCKTARLQDRKTIIINTDFILLKVNYYWLNLVKDILI